LANNEQVWQKVCQFKLKCGVLMVEEIEWKFFFAKGCVLPTFHLAKNV